MAFGPKQAAAWFMAAVADDPARGCECVGADQPEIIESGPQLAAARPRLCAVLICALVPSTWTWCDPPPRSWRAQVPQNADGIEVSFCVLNRVGTQVISRVTDRYHAGKYTFTTTQEDIAFGGGGIIW